MTIDDNDFGDISEDDLPKPPPVEPAGISAASATPPARSELSSIGSLLKESWGVFFSRFFTLILIMLLGTLLMVIGTAISFIPLAISKSLFPLTMILAIVIIFYTMARYYAALYFAVTSKDCNVREAFKETRNKALPFIWIIMLQGSVIIGGYFLFFIPGVILSVWLFPALFIFLAEGERGMNSLLKSREYVRGLGPKVFIRLFISILIVMGLGLIPFVGPFLSFILAPFPLIFAYLLYKELKEIKGDFDFKPSRKAKFALVAVAIIGPFIPVIVAIAMIGTAGISMLPMLAKTMTGTQNEMTINMQGNNLSSFKVTTTPARPQSIEADIKALLKKDDQPFERGHAAIKLGNSGSQKAVRALITALENDESWVVKKNSATALGQLKANRAVAPLINTLERDENVFVREAAATALGEIKNKIAIGPLKKALKDQAEVSRSYYDKDGTYKQQQVKSVVIAAGEALKKMGVSAKAKATEAQPRSEVKTIKVATEKIITKITAKANSTVPQTVPLTVPEVSAQQNKKIEKQYKKWIGVKYTFEQDRARVADQRLSWIKRSEAIRRLGKSGRGAAASPLVSALTTDSDPFIRREAAIALGTLGDVRAFEVLNNALYDEDQSVREASEASLQQLLKIK